MQYSATSCIYLIGLYTKEKFTYTCFKNLDLANSFLTREFPDKGSACESRAFFTDISSVLQLLTMLLNQGINVRITQLFCFRKTSKPPYSASTAIVQLPSNDKLQHI